MKDLKNLKGAKELGKAVQKSITGGIRHDGNCSCFCYRNGGNYQSSCFTTCPDGSIPGQDEGNSEDCFPVGWY